ncbi:MAG: ribonuclease HII [Verrucomicrobiota bacterium]
MKKNLVKWVPSWEEEDRALVNGYVRIAGVDEAGRGPWAGPVVAAAVVVLPEQRAQFPLGINDSKKLTAAHREDLYQQITSGGGWCFGIGVSSVSEIDEVNILQATFLAMRRALEELGNTPDFLLVDGKQLPGDDYPGTALVKGDSRSVSIAAASILAKEHRDRMMIDQLDREFPGYGFAKHKGYGTKQHQEALNELGPCSAHRQSFAPIRQLLETQKRS